MAMKAAKSCRLWMRNTKLPGYINLFKDKVEFRKLIKSIYPNFFFKEVSFKDIDQLDLEDLPMPFIIKPAVGFLSLGVHKVVNAQEWSKVKDEIISEFTDAKAVFPIEVVNTSSFIIEEVIEGDEFAFDAYFDENGKAVPVPKLDPQESKEIQRFQLAEQRREQRILQQKTDAMIKRSSL